MFNSAVLYHEHEVFGVYFYKSMKFYDIIYKIIVLCSYVLFAPSPFSAFQRAEHSIGYLIV